MAGSIITVLSARGGSGKTAVACNLAVVLSERRDMRVCLVDLDLERGDVAAAFGIASPQTWLAPGAADDGVSEALLHRLTTRVLTGLDCVLAPETPGDSEKISARFVETLLIALRSHYDYVVVDTTSRISSRVLVALDLCDHQLLVTTPSFPALKNLRATLDMLDLVTASGAARSIVLNQSGAEGSLTDDTIEHLIRGPLAAHLPASPDVLNSINAGVPLASAQPRHLYVRAISDFSEALLTTVHLERQP